MNAETLEALHGSIRKWERIVSGEGVDEGARNCPLCQLFNGNTEETALDCCGCPVFEKTRSTSCQKTPYDRWMKMMPDSWKQSADTDEKREIARAELKFLRGLLP